LQFSGVNRAVFGVGNGALPQNAYIGTTSGNSGGLNILSNGAFVATISSTGAFTTGSSSYGAANTIVAGSIASVSSTAKLLWAADPGGQNYIESGNAAFSAGATLNLTGPSAVQGTDLVINFARSSFSGVLAINAGLNFVGNTSTAGEAGTDLWIARDGAAVQGFNFNVPTGSTYGWRFLTNVAQVAQISSTGSLTLTGSINTSSALTFPSSANSFQFHNSPASPLAGEIWFGDGPSTNAGGWKIGFFDGNGANNMFNLSGSAGLEFLLSGTSIYGPANCSISAALTVSGAASFRNYIQSDTAGINGGDLYVHAVAGKGVHFVNSAVTYDNMIIADGGGVTVSRGSLTVAGTTIASTFQASGVGNIFNGNSGAANSTQNLTLGTYGSGNYEAGLSSQSNAFIGVTGTAVGGVLRLYPNGTGSAYTAAFDSTTGGAATFYGTGTGVTAALQVPNGDIYTARNNNTGVIFLGNSGAHYLYFDGSNYQLPQGALVVGNGGVTAGGVITGSAFTANGGGIVFNAPSATTGYCYASIGNNLSSLILGVGSNTGNGGLFYGGLPYYGVIGTSLNYGFQIATNNTVRMTIDNVGQTTFTGVIKGMSPSAYGALSVVGEKNAWGGISFFTDFGGTLMGTLMVNSSNVGFYNATDNGFVTYWDTAGGIMHNTGAINATAFYVTSSREKKKDIQPIGFDALKAITQTAIVSFRYKDGPDQDEKLGFIAEDTPTELVGIEPRFDTNRVLSVALAAIKQLEARLALLENK
jgi:hypothetical protein